MKEMNESVSYDPQTEKNEKKEAGQNGEDIEQRGE